MKKALVLSVLMTAGSVLAEPVDLKTEAKQTGVVMGSFITGGVAGGPLGAIAGLVAGAWLGEQVVQADQVEVIEQNLQKANHQVADLTQKLSQSESRAQQFAQIALDQLQLELLFKTGDSELTPSGQQRITYLANFLVNNPVLTIRLDGYTDPRGDTAFNQTLSDKRVDSVAALLIDHGVEQQRIKTYSHGASQSQSVVGDYDAYALERVVKIQLSQGDSKDAYAQVMIAE